MPISIVLSQGQASDKTIAPLLIEQLQPGRDLIADRGYDARALVDLVARRGGRAHIPTCPDRKIQRSVDLALYRQRNLVEPSSIGRATAPAGSAGVPAGEGHDYASSTLLTSPQRWRRRLRRRCRRGKSDPTHGVPLRARPRLLGHLPAKLGRNEITRHAIEIVPLTPHIGARMTGIDTRGRSRRRSRGDRSGHEPACRARLPRPGRHRRAAARLHAQFRRRSRKAPTRRHRKESGSCASTPASPTSPTSTRTAEARARRQAAHGCSWATGCGTPTARSARCRRSTRCCAARIVPTGGRQHRVRRHARGLRRARCGDQGRDRGSGLRALADLLARPARLHRAPPEERAAFRPVRQRLVRTHPVTGPQVAVPVGAYRRHRRLAACPRRAPSSAT